MKNRSIVFTMFLVITCAFCLLSGAPSDIPAGKELNGSIFQKGDAAIQYSVDPGLGIETVPPSMGSTYTSQFDRYTKVTAPNGGAIHIVAQSQVSNEQMVRARNILQHYLTDYSGSQYGTDKDAVANKMVENNAILLLLNGADDGNNDRTVDGQARYEQELI